MDKEDSQLVVLSGDPITGENTYEHNSTDYANEIVQPSLNRGLLWASTNGDRDSDFNAVKAHNCDSGAELSNRLTRQDVHANTSGVSNYYLPVYFSDAGKLAPELLLWFFGSRGGKYYQTLNSTGNEVPQPNRVGQTVVDWFTAARTKLHSQYGKDVPSLAFVHVPSYAMLAFQQGPGAEPHH